MKDWKQYKPDTFEYMGRWIKNWFSNMIVSPLEIDGEMYNSVENYYQAMKTLDPQGRRMIAMALPNVAKKLGQRVDLRPDWEEVKYEIMKKALRVKFSEIQIWRKRLLFTGNEIIIEWNNWNDRIWGVSITDCIGENLLGKALMEIRDELK